MPCSRRDGESSRRSRRRLSRAFFTFSLGAGVTPAARRAGDYSFTLSGLERDWPPKILSCQLTRRCEIPMLYELRIYHCMPGKLPAVVSRFENATVKLFEKHGIQPVGFWTTVIGESNADLYYILK